MRKWKVILNQYTLVLVFCAFVFQSVSGQKLDPPYDQKPFNPTKFKLVTIGGGLFYAGTLTGLYTIWYKDYETAEFHWFNDNDGWMQIDKFGHMYTCYAFGKGGVKALQWAGVDRKKAIWFGGSFGFLFMTSVEILDAHYKAWGASAGDIACNAAGAALVIGQELGFNRQVVNMKFSYHPTDLAQYRPDQLGEGAIEKIIKDYNGQTYWFSANYASIFRNQRIVPKWLNIAGGYGAYGMLGSVENPEDLPEVERYRRYFISLDLDLDRIKTKSKFVNSVFFMLNMFKIPMPTVEFNEKGEVLFHPLYF